MLSVARWRRTNLYVSNVCSSGGCADRLSADEARSVARFGAWSRRHREPVPAVVLGWAPAPFRGAKASPWSCLVAACPSETALLVQWVAGERVVGVREATQLMDGSGSRRRRHVWVDTGGGGRHPGLILDWRRTEDGSWEAQVALARANSLLTGWFPQAALGPVADDRWR